jgi:hypothetical protein
MLKDRYLKTVLTLIALLLGVIALRPASYPTAVHAQSDYSHLFVEPGTTVLRAPDGRLQTQGKVVIDMRNGDIWGFPTDTSAPYPVYVPSPTPPVSRAIYLGKFDFSSMKRPAEGR